MPAPTPLSVLMKKIQPYSSSQNQDLKKTVEIFHTTLMQTNKFSLSTECIFSGEHGDHSV